MKAVEASHEKQDQLSTKRIELNDWLWYELPQQKNHPTHRQLHTGVIYGDEWFIFGGFAKEQPLDELWSLSLVTKEWRQVKKNSRSWPKPRHSHTATPRSYTSKTGRSTETMIVFGGVTENGEILNDVWEYSFKKSSWKKFDTTGDIPSPRWGHSSVIFHNELWVFGGFSGSWNNDLYCLNLATLKWRKVTTEGSPSARHFHSADICNDRMYIFGGLSTQDLNDLKSFHFATEKWENIEATNAISPRRGHQSIIFDHYLIIHGGRNNNEASNDLQFFDFDIRTWETVKMNASAPTPRYFHSIGFWQNTIFVFGGLGVIRHYPPLDKNGKIKNRNLNDLYCCSHKRNFTDVNSINGRFATVPLDILKYCLEYFDQASLARMSQVNRFFYYLSSADYLWKRILYRRVQRDYWLASTLREIENGYATWNTRADFNNNNKNTFDDLLSLMQSRMKPDITQFYWKNRYANRMNGFSWKPQRDPNIVNVGFDNLYHTDASCVRLKLTVLGDGGVGKSTTTIMFTQNHFVEEYDPTIENSYRKQVRIAGQESPMVLDVLDTAGEEEFCAPRDAPIRCGQGFIIMYSVTNRVSFEQVSYIVERICRVKDSVVSDVPVVIVGNKCDLNECREVTTDEGRELAQKYDYPFFEASAKLKVNTDQQFHELTKEVAYKYYAKDYAKQAQAAVLKKDKCVLQ